MTKRNFHSNLGCNVNHFSIDFATHACLLACKVFDCFTSRLTIVAHRVHVPLVVYSQIPSKLLLKVYSQFDGSS